MLRISVQSPRVYTSQTGDTKRAEGDSGNGCSEHPLLHGKRCGLQDSKPSALHRHSIQRCQNY